MEPDPPSEKAMESTMSSLQFERTISGNSVVVAANDQLSADLDDESVILDLESGVYYGLDAVGSRIWSLIQEPKTVNDVRDILLEEYKVDPNRCKRELYALLQELAAHGLVEVQDETHLQVP
jgi:hypothetical protein